MWRQRPFRLLITGAGLLILVFSVAPAAASSANVSRSFQSKTALPSGSIVSLDPARSDYVEFGNTANSSRLIGAVVVSNESLIAADNRPGTTQVATSGNAPVLVSDLNGDIKVGDQVTVSPLNGVGMKATTSGRTIGLAQTDFNGRTEGTTTREVTDKQGRKSTVRVGYARVGIDITNSGGTSGEALNDLQRVVHSVTGRTVATPKIIISLGIIIVAMLALITLTYASIYGSIISVGRNPLAKYAVFRTLASVLGIALLTAVLAGVSIYFLLR